MNELDRDFTRWNLKFVLQRRRIRQWQLARAMDRDPSWISKLVTGVIDPNDEDLARLATILELKPDELDAMFSHQGYHTT